MEPRKIFLAKRTIALAMFAIVLVQVVPSLADVLTNSSDSAPTSTQQPAPTASTDPSPAPISTAAAAPTASPQPSGSYTYLAPSESPTPDPTLAELQDVILRVPSKFPVDPRATSMRLAPINLYSKSDLLLCISASNAQLVLTSQSEKVLVAGNNSKFLVLSGGAGDISALLNSGQGLRVLGSPRIQGATLFARAAALTRPSLNPDLCGQATAHAHSQVVALGLGMDTVKNPLPLK